MNSRSVVTLLLLLFVGASLAYMVMKQGGGMPETSPAESMEPGSPTLKATAGRETGDSSGESGNVGGEPIPSAPSDGVIGTGTDEVRDRKVLVYYFHRTQRCPTCRAIESYARDAVRAAFPAELESGRIEWQSFNLDAPANRRFVDDYQLSFSSLIVAEVQGGRTVRWENLADVWTLVHGDREQYDGYVQEAVARHLGS